MSLIFTPFVLFFLETKQRLKYISSIKDDASVEQCGEVSNVLDRSEFGESSQPIRTDEVKSISYQTVESHCTESVDDSKQRTEMTVYLNETKSVQKEIFCINDTKKEVRYKYEIISMAEMYNNH